MTTQNEIATYEEAAVDIKEYDEAQIKYLTDRASDPFYLQEENLCQKLDDKVKVEYLISSKTMQYRVKATDLEMNQVFGGLARLTEELIRCWIVVDGNLDVNATPDWEFDFR